MTRRHTSARVRLSFPPKNGPTPSSNGSISFSTICTNSPARFSFSSPSDFKIGYSKELTFPMNVSTKKEILALSNALVGVEWLAGQKVGEGKSSAMKVLTMADSVRISSSRMPLLILMLGTRPRGLTLRYQGSRGRSRGMMTSS